MDKSSRDPLTREAATRWPRGIAVAFACALGLCSFHGIAHAGPLDRADEEASGSSSGGSGSSDHSRRSTHSKGGCRSCNDGGEDDGALALLLMRGMVEALIFPWKVPYRMLEGERVRDAETNRCLTRYATIPYDSAAGVLRSSCNVEDGHVQGRPVKLLGSLESGYMVQGVLPTTVSARLLLPKRAELSFRGDYLRDLHDRSEPAYAGTALLTVRFAQSQRAQFRTGAGVRLFHLTKPRWGLDLLYAFDIYGRHPVVFRGELHGGFVEAAGVFQARATLGGMLGRVELFAGGEYTYMSDGNGAGAPLGGPIAGVRAWF